MAVSAALSLLADYLVSLREEKLNIFSFGSPSGGSLAAPMGLTFLKGFVDGVKSKGMTVDAIALHW